MSRRQTLLVRKLPVCLLLLLIFVFLSACKTSTDAAAAAKELSAVSSQLDKYYDDLEKQLDDTVRLNELQQAIYGIPFDSDLRAKMMDTKSEIAKRDKMADCLGKLADAYAKLAGSTASADASTAASGLATALSDAKAIPGGSDIPAAAGEAAKLLVSFAQSQSLEHGAVAVKKSIDAVAEIFDKEQPVYESINKQRMAIAQSVAENLLQNNELDIDFAPLVAPALKPFSLSSRPKDVSKDPAYQKLVKSEIEYQAEDEERQYAETTKDLSAALHAVQEKVEHISGKK